MTDALDVPAITEAIRALPRRGAGIIHGRSGEIAHYDGYAGASVEQLISLYNRLLD